MLIEFRVANYRSLRESQTLRLTASPAEEWASTHTFKTDQAAFPRLLRSSVLYGANASGKTTLLRALQFVQAFVVQSAAAALAQPISNASSSQVGSKILVTPFAFNKANREKPSEFELVIVENGVRYQYGFIVDAERVHDEWLVAYPHGRPQRWFERTYDPKLKKYRWNFSAKLKGDYQVWRNATRQNVLFLSMAIQLNSEQLRPVFNWIQQRLVVISGGTQLNAGLTFTLLDTPEGKSELMKFIKAADLGIDDVDIKREQLPPGFVQMVGVHAVGPSGNGGGVEMRRMQLMHKSVGQEELVPLELNEESAGTVKLLNTAGAFLKVLKNGEVIFIDEMDVSLHPLMVRFLINLFHGNRTNKGNAQLFFTTHDTSVLTGEIFRRDQVWFVEKDKQGASRLYSLLEFSPRKNEALAKGYLQGRYGALPFIGELRI